MTKDLAYYLALPYERVWERRDDDGDRYIVVSLRQIPGVCAWGRSEPEAKEHLTEAFEDYLTWRLEESLPIPEPDGPSHEAERVLAESTTLK